MTNVTLLLPSNYIGQFDPDFAYRRYCDRFRDYSLGEASPNGVKRYTDTRVCVGKEPVNINT